MRLEIIWVHADIICRDSDNHTIPIVLTQCVQVKDVMAWLLSLTDPHRKKMYTLEGGYNRNKITRTRTLCSVDRHLTLSNDPELPPFSSPTNEVRPENTHKTHAYTNTSTDIYIWHIQTNTNAYI